jgi:hypothetical protein
LTLNERTATVEKVKELIKNEVTGFDNDDIVIMDNEDLEKITDENKSVGSDRPAHFYTVEAATTILGTATIVTDAALRLEKDLTTGMASNVPTHFKSYVEPFVHQ